MGLSQSVVSGLLDAFRNGDGVDLIRESMHLVMQELTEADATEQIGAARHQRTESRSTETHAWRNYVLASGDRWR
jgi:transposase-like protein